MASANTRKAMNNTPIPMTTGASHAGQVDLGAKSMVEGMLTGT
jgi:hypothetical protein